VFSSIGQHFDQPQNRLYQERERRRASGLPVLDLVSGNVHDQGIHFPADSLRKAMDTGLRLSRSYRPDPRGQKKAREGISRFYRTEGLSIPPEQLILTPGTSLSYLYAFKLLGNPGDEFLCPRPTYPLFDSIATLADIQLRPYPLRPEGRRWVIDWEGLSAAITDRSRAIVLISPHNPTGAVASPEEVDRLCHLAAEKDLAIISDEVFSPFVFAKGPLPRPASHATPLVLTLNGFSKMFALPGSKIGWMAVTGPAPRVQQALKTLEMISDTFLPVHEAAQAAVPLLFQRGRPFLNRFQTEVRRRMRLATRELSRYPVFDVIPPEGGFYLAVRLTNGLDDERFAYEALHRHGLLIHPGFFYELEGSYFVLSGMEKPAVLRTALRTLARLARGGRGRCLVL
jgi:aspartate/methionine/tyrosine aminotransferase